MGCEAHNSHLFSQFKTKAQTQFGTHPGSVSRFECTDYGSITVKDPKAKMYLHWQFLIFTNNLLSIDIRNYVKRDE